MAGLYCNIPFAAIITVSTICHSCTALTVLIQYYFGVLVFYLLEHLFCCSLCQVRCTAGFSCTQRLGPGVENMPGELEVANITPHHTIVCRLEHDGRKLEEGGMVYIQVTIDLRLATAE